MRKSKGDESFGYGMDWGIGGTGSGGQGAEECDAEHRKAYGGVLPAAYYGILGPCPSLNPGDRDGATAYLGRIEAAIEHGDWTRNERTRLYQMRDKWRRRAAGEDRRFELVGNHSGGLDEHNLRQVRSRNTLNRVVKFRRELEEMLSE